MKRAIGFCCGAAMVALTTYSLKATTLISDNFETNSSSNYTVVSQDPINGSVTFAFDYVAAGIPLAPRSSPGDTRGLRLTVNDFAGFNNTQTVFHNTVVDADVYRLKVDVFMFFVAGGSTTEHAHVGVGGDGTTPNSLFNPIEGSGSFIAFTGDGGSGSDYRWFLTAANGGPTTYPNDHFSYLGHGSNNTNAFYTEFFPSPPSTVPGVPGNIWTTVEVLVNNPEGRIQYFMTNSNGDRELFFDSSPDTLETPVQFSGVLQGLVSLGLHDAFVSVSGPDCYTVYDNLVVEAVVPGATIVDSFVYHGGWSGLGSPIDSGKTLAQEGNGPQPLTYDNLINTTRGLNGLIFDIEGLGDGASLNASDFVFQVSPQGAFDAGLNPPTGWANAPSPSSITVTPGSPDRVLIEWPDNEIRNRWLRVTILDTPNTGLAEPSVFYIGHVLGETTGLSGSIYSVSFADVTPVRSQVGNAVDASSIADIDKNGTVAFSDISALLPNVGVQLTNITID